MLFKNSDRTDRGHSFPAKPDHPLIASAPYWAALFVTAVFVSGCVVHSRGHGQGHYKGPVKVQPHADVHVSPAPVAFVFTDHHRHAVRNYYSHHPHHPKGKKHKWKGKGKGRGHPGRGHGPPPWARKGGHMPPGIAMQGIPHDLATQLPPPPHGTQFIYYSDQVLLVDVHSHVVLDSISISIGF